mmetsp:Transcript_27733/g.58730  ORF Transcript_27733/g.58730 Transcript_27733/m.58730 type:complete len:295 (-) Transcript_27733:47-931(-)
MVGLEFPAAARRRRKGKMFGGVLRSAFRAPGPGYGRRTRRGRSGLIWILSILFRFFVPIPLDFLQHLGRNEGMEHLPRQSVRFLRLLPQSLGVDVGSEQSGNVSNEYPIRGLEGVLLPFRQEYDSRAFVPVDEDGRGEDGVESLFVKDLVGVEMAFGRAGGVVFAECFGAHSRGGSGEGTLEVRFEVFEIDGGLPSSSGRRRMSGRDGIFLFLFYLLFLFYVLFLLYLFFFHFFFLHFFFFVHHSDRPANLTALGPTIQIQKAARFALPAAALFGEVGLDGHEVQIAVDGHGVA